MKNHFAGCKLVYEGLDGKQYSGWGSLFNLYIFRKRKWTKIGVFCTSCGVILDPERLEDSFEPSELNKQLVEVATIRPNSDS